jgi:hypothetical protein
MAEEQATGPPGEARQKRRRIDWDEGELALVADAFVAALPDTLALSTTQKMEKAQQVLPEARRRTGFDSMNVNRRFMDAVQARVRRLLEAGRKDGMLLLPAEMPAPGTPEHEALKAQAVAGMEAALERADIALLRHRAEEAERKLADYKKAAEEAVVAMHELRQHSEQERGAAEADVSRLRNEAATLRSALAESEEQRQLAQAQASSALAMPTEKLLALLMGRAAAAVADVKGGILAEVGGIVGVVREDVGRMRQQLEGRMQRLEAQAAGPRGPATLSPAPALTPGQERTAYMPAVLVANRADWRADFQRLQEALRPLKIRLSKIDTSKPSQMRVDAHDVLFIWRTAGVTDELVGMLRGRSRKCVEVPGTLADLQAAVQAWVEKERRPKAVPAEANGASVPVGAS